jgi:hypothetical protein
MAMLRTSSVRNTITNFPELGKSKISAFPQNADFKEKG